MFVGHSGVRRAVVPSPKRSGAASDGWLGGWLGGGLGGGVTAGPSGLPHVGQKAPPSLGLPH